MIYANIYATLGLMTLEETLFGQIWNPGDNREPEDSSF
jgi:hypothetical protein